MSDVVLKIKGLTKLIKQEKILHSIDLEVQRGSVYGLIGQNGAGKTTFLRTISGLMKATEGTIDWNIEKKYIGYMPQTCQFNGSMKVRDAIKFFAEIKQADMNESMEILRKMKLDETKKMKYLSPGQQKKLQLTLAMAGNPDFYILDEPTAGLDPYAAHEMKGIISKLKEEGKTVIISAHILQDMKEICTHIAIMESGKLTYCEPLVEDKMQEIISRYLHFEEGEND